MGYHCTARPGRHVMSSQLSFSRAMKEVYPLVTAFNLVTTRTFADDDLMDRLQNADPIASFEDASQIKTPPPQISLKISMRRD